MANYNYSKKLEIEENAAKAVGLSLPISTKYSVEICNFIRQMPLEKAKKRLAEVIEKKRAVPFKRYSGNTGHKKGMAAGQYPKKACSEILKILESAEANAQFKGLNTSNLVISHICAQKASRPWHYGRQGRRKMKRTHIEVIVSETRKIAEKRGKERAAKKIKAKEQEKVQK